MKPCKDCGAETVYKPRRAMLCKPCRASRLRAYCKRTDYHRRRYIRTAQQERERHLVRKYGVTQADYDRMLRDQDGRCAVCGKTQARAFDVDHCHTSGKVRGLLCTSCNRMIGHAGDSVERLRAAAEYLKKGNYILDSLAVFD